MVEREWVERAVVPVLIVTGPPGVGKTTTARIVAERSARSVHLEVDTFFHFIRSGHVEPWTPESHEQNRVVMEIVAAAAAAYASAGYFTLVDGIVLPEWFLTPLSDVLHGAGHRVAYAVLREPVSVCAVRVQAREGDPTLVDTRVIEQIGRGFVDLGELERHALDLEGRSPEQVADLLTQQLLDGGQKLDFTG